MPASAISSKSSFSGTPKTRFANRAIFFGLCSAMNVIHAGTITASPAPCITLYTALVHVPEMQCSLPLSLLHKYRYRHSPTHDIGACFVIVRVLYFLCFFDDSHQSPFTQPVTDFYIGSVGKITFHNVYHHIGNATSCLVGGESIGQLRIHHSKNRP